jgi:hypothetical protein
MTVVDMQILHGKREIQHRLRLDKATRDAVADLARRRWPLKTASYAAKAWGLTPDQARGMVAARASQATIDRIFKIGGWPVVFSVFAEVIGQSADAYLIELRNSHHDQAARLGALAGGLRPLAADRSPRDPDLPDALDSGTGAFADRRAQG